MKLNIRKFPRVLCSLKQHLNIFKIKVVTDSTTFLLKQANMHRKPVFSFLVYKKIFMLKLLFSRLSILSVQLCFFSAQFHGVFSIDFLRIFAIYRQQFCKLKLVITSICYCTEKTKLIFVIS